MAAGASHCLRKLTVSPPHWQQALFLGVASANPSKIEQLTDYFPVCNLGKTHQPENLALNILYNSRADTAV
jgi:hypothetical protein